MLPTTSSFISGLAGQLRTMTDQGRQRNILPVRPKGTGCLQYQGNEYLNLAGNDSLGLAGNLSLLQKFYTSLEQQDQLIEQFGLGSGASRLMTGSHQQYAQLEEGLARYYDKDRALIFNSGYHINIGLLPVLAQKGDLIFADKLCHASLIDGMRLSQARMIRFPHLDYDRLEQLLQKHHTAPRGSTTTSTSEKKQNIFIV
ncbi:MAG: aminotransferase class I/II-fold pyridoxal phosphate-dependent enzyme, partial [Candidatus Electrothrix sp. MAN1_4]|nr:aminotransferase class I/II-fold pyridoxal phosphate-dependent enzyme [Candidatus Electrothrix sp. MAN1_4]